MIQHLQIFPPDIELPSPTGAKPVKVKYGIDPTASRLHLGHFVGLRILKEMIENGYEAHIIIGTFTAQMGDPSGRDAMRPILDEEEVIKNGNAYLPILNRILGKGFKVHQNHIWFRDMSGVDLMNIFAKFTTAQLLHREAFQKRILVDQPVGVHEMLVPILQGIDSFNVGADVEIGGTDQLFNFQITRAVQQSMGQNPEICILCPIINGTDGRKMSKTYDNCIWLDDEPNDIYGKVMRISDATMWEWVKLFTGGVLSADVDTATELLADPMKQKKWLAYQITQQLMGEDEAKKAQDYFEQVIQNKSAPKNMPLVDLVGETKKLLCHYIKKFRQCSRSEANRLLSQNAVYVNDKLVVDGNMLINSGDVIKIGHSYCSAR